MKKYLLFCFLSLFLLMTITPRFSYAEAINNKVNDKKQTSFKTNSTVDIKQILLPKVVIYNTHTLGKYSFGESIVDVSKAIRDRFLEKGVDCVYLENNIDVMKYNYADLFNISRKLITNNIPNYKDYILLDIDVMLGHDNNTGTEFRALLSDYNEKFIDKMLINYKPVLFQIPGNKKNQDLSNKQIYMIMGNENTQKDVVYSNIDHLVNAITSTIK